MVINCGGKMSFKTLEGHGSLKLHLGCSASTDRTFLPVIAKVFKQVLSTNEEPKLRLIREFEGDLVESVFLGGGTI